MARSAESVRHPVLWDLVEPKKGKFKWKNYDSFVSRLARYRVRLEAVLGFSAPWARTTGHSGAPPANPSDFAAYARAVAARYGRGGSFWKQNPALPYVPVAEYEVWNEPNDAANWYPTPNPVAYARTFIEQMLRMGGERYRGRPATLFQVFPR